MKKSLLLVVLLAIVAAPAAFAENFTISYEITSYYQGSWVENSFLWYTWYTWDKSDGLSIAVNNPTGSASRDIALNATKNNTIDLFKISADEKQVQQDDKQAKLFRVNFTFDPPGTDRTVDGYTFGADAQRDNYGNLTWGDTGTTIIPLSFGNGGHYTVELDPVKFSEVRGKWGSLDPDKSTTVQATIHYDKAPSSVPEPGTLAMMGSGLLGLGGMIRRKFGR